MDNQKLVSILEKKGYRFVGRHSAIKICEWCRESVRGNNVCYKEKFYGISSHRCIQMSPAVFFCDHKCLFCWRSTPFLPKWSGVADEPTDIIDGCIEEQKKILQGFFGGECDKKKLREAMQPKHVAISLVGEPTLYPKLPQLIDEIKDRKMTAFLVSNGTQTVAWTNRPCSTPISITVGKSANCRNEGGTACTVYVRPLGRNNAPGLNDSAIFPIILDGNGNEAFRSLQPLGEAALRAEIEKVVAYG